MLERVFIIRHIIIIIVGISKEGIARGKHITGAEVGRWQLCLMRVLNGKDVARRAVEVLTQLIPKIGIGVAVAYNLHSLRYAYAAMVGGDNNATIALRQGGQ